jgi:hypothetical protein
VVAFGHPATFQGKITAALLPAEALYIQEDPVFGGFKVANVADPVGTISDDHQTGITGTLGPLPTTFDVTSTVTYGARSRTGSSHVPMKDFNASATFYEFVANHERVMDSYGPGSELTDWTIHGRKKDGSPFTVSMGDRFTSAYDITYDAVWDIPDMVYVLGRFPGVTLDDVSMSSTVTDDTATWKVTSVQRKVRGVWVTIKGRRDVVVARTGSTLKLRATLSDADGATKRVVVGVDIPSRASGSTGTLYVAGGSKFYSDWYGAKSLWGFLSMAKDSVRNDEVVGVVSTSLKRSSLEFQGVSNPQDRVVSGRKFFSIAIR